MQIIAIEESAATVELEWTTAAALAAACRHAYLSDVPGLDPNNMDVFASMFEAMALAGYMQGASSAEKITLKTLHHKLGLVPTDPEDEPPAA